MKEIIQLISLIFLVMFLAPFAFALYAYARAYGRGYIPEDNSVDNWYRRDK